MPGIGNFFDASSSSNAEDSRLAVTDQGTGIRGTGNRVLHSGALDFTQARIQSAPNYNLKADKGATINITEGGSGSSDQLLGLVSSLFAAQSQAGAAASVPPPATNVTGDVTTSDVGSSDSIYPPPARNPVDQTSSSGLSIWLVLAAVGVAIFFLLKK